MTLTGAASSIVLAADRLVAAIDGGDPLLPGWGQLGVLGLLVVAFFTDKIVTGKKYDAAIAERDKERERTERAEAFLRDTVSGMVTESTLALRTVDAEVLPLIRETLPLLRETKEALMHNKENKT